MNIKIEQIGGKLTKSGLQLLMGLYSDDLFLFVRGIVNNNETAEELVSDVFLKIWNRRESFSTIVNIKSYLFILARNEAISYIRKNKRLKILSLEEVSEYFFSPLEHDDSDQFNQEMIDQINDAIELLPVKCKMAFSLAKISGLKYKEIAEIMGISPLTVKNHVAYALEKIYTQVANSSNEPNTKQKIYLFLLTNQKTQ